MKTILLVGAAYNFYGGIVLLRDLWRREVGVPRDVHPGFTHPVVAADYLHLRIFMFNTALMFGGMYVFLYFRPEYIFPFLIFGTVHKYTTFGAALVARVRRRWPTRAFWLFGVGNLILAIAFTVVLATG